MSNPTIAITGVGLITGAGDDVEKCWASLVEGTTGIRQNTLFDTSELLSSWVGLVTAEQRADIDRCYSLAATAVSEALAGSGLDLSTVDRDRVAVVVGSSLGAMSTLEDVHRKLVATGELDAVKAAGSQVYCVGDFIAAEFDLRGPRIVLSNACAASAVAVGYAAELLWRGDVDYVVCGGVDPIAFLSASGFTSLGALDPEPCSPMAASTGLTLGEGAGFMILEAPHTAAERGADVLAEVGGYGLTCDGYHQTAPDPGGKGAFASMKQALHTAGLTPSDVDYINLHGTGTPANDVSEPKAIKLLYQGGATPPVSSTKSMVGHTLGAAGAVEGVVSTLAISRGALPPTINTRGIEPPSKLDIIPDTGRPGSPAVVLSNSFAFGGNNATVVYTKPGQPTGAKPTEAVRDVLITGVAGLAGSATDTEALTKSFVDNESCFAQQVDIDGLGNVPFGRVDTSVLAGKLNPGKARRMDPLSILASSVVRDVYARHGKQSRAEQEETGIVFATGIGPCSSVVGFHEPVITGGMAAANPLIFPNTVVNAAAGHVAMQYRYRGYTATIVNGGTSSVLALQLASRVIARGGAERIMVVVADEYPQPAVRTVASLPGYSRDGAVVPHGRTGAVLSEGAVAILLESPEAASSRGATALASVAGFGLSGESVGIGGLGPDGSAWARSLRLAMGDAGDRPVDAVVSAASGRRLVDLAEKRALAAAGLAETPVVTPKAVFGETFGSAAGLGLVAALTGGVHGRVLLSSFAYGGSYAAAVLDIPSAGEES
ncbi:beta-ketoacyl-[acyl-carrier-protein] synthase family protein [Labedaea rhizosphaerae]|uniref:3-oxoacyl-[acyl-carrier-protein] synthase II n=1 Tax=Labedaea rhizosphaerae TaxID=598644 RepID=A0A4V3CZ34_LABRH|nr:beta-ketoacyl-[acyl-carrier-protein] synthase family protein [Labedaea rhizosphaerae]TDP96478.1 3-oxoacyl-[acyl-carrier-protein] synthase II [Labedaea rhizosphaerae]